MYNKKIKNLYKLCIILLFAFIFAGKKVEAQSSQKNPETKLLLQNQNNSATNISQSSSGASTSVSQIPLNNFKNVAAGSSTTPLLSINLANSQNPDDLVPALRVVGILTLLAFAPAILLLTSAFTRITIVLSFLRQALGSPTMPPNQVIIGMSLFLTYFVMAPTTNIIYEKAIVPYMDHQITSAQALDESQKPIRKFMLAQTRKEDLALFLKLAKNETPKTVADIPLSTLIPSFIISELRSAFQIGFIVYLPFIIIDMIVSSVLMSMGMMMLPPTIVSLPLKIILFVLVDGWNLLAGSIVKSFA